MRTSSKIFIVVAIICSLIMYFTPERQLIEENDVTGIFAGLVFIFCIIGLLSNAGFFGGGD